MASKLLLSATLITAVLVAPMVQADGQGVFIQAGAGHSDIHRAGTAWHLGGGYRWATARSLYVGVEGGYIDFGTAHYRSTADQVFDNPGGAQTISYDTRGAVGTKALTIGLNARYDITDRTYAIVRGGMARYRERYRAHNTSVIDGGAPEASTYGYKLYDTRWYAGAGFGFDFTPNISLQFAYDYYPQRYSVYGFRFKENASVWSTAVEYRF